MKRIFIIFCCLLLNGYIFSQTGSQMTKTGTTAAQFLKIGMGTRSIGMGGAYVALSDDIYSMYWNPGGLAKVYSGSATFSHIQWIADIGIDYAAVSYELQGFGTIGLNITTLGIDDIAVRTTDEPEGTGEKYSAGDLSIGLCYARNLTDRFSIGFSAKYLREYIWHMSATGFAFDVGMIYTSPFFDGLRLGASITNFGPKMKLDGRDTYLIYYAGAANENVVNAEYQLDGYELPLQFKIGLSSDVIKQEQIRLTACLDAVHPNDNTEYLNSGVEFAWNEMIFLRAGYKSIFEKNTEQGLTGGIGLDYRISSGLSVVMDYAYLDFGRLNAVHYISVGVKF
jgi:opacity protein-like surface antigen